MEYQVGELFFFYWIQLFISILLIFCSLFVMFTERLIYAILGFILINILCLFFLICFQFDFLAFILILIYAGITPILFLFIIMSTRKVTRYTNSNGLYKRYYLGLINIFLSILFLMILLNSWYVSCYTLIVPSIKDVYAESFIFNNIEIVGKHIYTDHWLPFVLMGLILLVSMIGTAVIFNRAKKLNVLKLKACKKNKLKELE